MAVKVHLTSTGQWQLDSTDVQRIRSIEHYLMDDPFNEKWFVSVRVRHPWRKIEDECHLRSSRWFSAIDNDHEET